MIGNVGDEYLSLVFESSKGSRMKNPVTISLERQSEIRGLLKVGIHSAGRLGRPGRVHGQPTTLVGLELFLTPDQL
jgi:hypothetical protein